MQLGVDIIEDELLALGGNVLKTLLTDHTTENNIIWATDDYASHGDGFHFNDPISIESITGENGHIVMPRISKALQQQRDRSQSMAEVFTPSWVCNTQNNLIDDAWFGCSNVFNTENDDNTWTSYATPNIPKDRRWKD